MGGKRWLVHWTPAGVQLRVAHLQLCIYPCFHILMNKFMGYYCLAAAAGKKTGNMDECLVKFHTQAS